MLLSPCCRRETRIQTAKKTAIHSQRNSKIAATSLPLFYATAGTGDSPELPPVPSRVRLIKKRVKHDG